MCQTQAWIRPSEANFALPKPTWSPKIWGSHITYKTSWKYIKYPPDRPSETNFALPESTQWSKSHKKGRLEPARSPKTSGFHITNFKTTLVLKKIFSIHDPKCSTAMPFFHQIRFLKISNLWQLKKKGSASDLC